MNWPRRRLVWSSLSFLSVGAVAASNTSCNGASSDYSTVHGAITTSGPKLGAWAVYPNICRTGEREGFYGVDLYSDANKAWGVRVVKTPEKVSVIVNETGAPGKGLGFLPASCKVLQVSLTRSRIRDTQGLFYIDGTLELNCTSEGAVEHIEGQVDFHTCGG